MKTSPTATRSTFYKSNLKLHDNVSTAKRSAGGGATLKSIARNDGRSSGTDGLNIGGGFNPRKTGRYIHVGNRRFIVKGL